MNQLLSELKKDGGISRVLAAIEGGRCPAMLSGVSAIHRSHMVTLIRESTQRPIVLLCSDEQEAKKLALDVEALCGERVMQLFGREMIFRNMESASRQEEQNRLCALYTLVNNRAPLTVATLEGLLMRTLPKEVLCKSVVRLQSGEEYRLEKVTATLIRAGYYRTMQVEGPGQFSLRGGILDFFSPLYPQPVRCEFFGDEIDSMGLFDISSQRRTENVEEAMILPAAEAAVELFEGGKTAFLEKLDRLRTSLSKKKNNPPRLLELLDGDMEKIRSGRELSNGDKYQNLLFEKACGLDYLPEDAVVILSEPGRLADTAKNHAWQWGEDSKTLLEEGALLGGSCDFFETWEAACRRLEDYPLVLLENFTTGKQLLPIRTLESVSAKQLPSYGGSLETAVSDIAHYLKSGFKTAVLCPDQRRCEILREQLSEKGIPTVFDFQFEKPPAANVCTIGLGQLTAGFEYPEIRLAVITEGQIVQSVFAKKKKKLSKRSGKKLDSFADLAPGDLVVHEHYGIGRFVGIVKRNVDKTEKDYIKIAYAGTDALYIPATQLDVISKYIGAGEDHPVKLSHMGGTDWARAKSKARGAVQDLAKGLIELQAQRKRQKGFAFSPDSEWQAEFEDAFEYQETDDQLRSIREIKEDMQSDMPMDRLLCGDVGYGKTEIALRAVMKCVLDGKQAAILVPTTVLAQQHFQTASRRFAGYPVRIEVLSRFRTPQQMKGAIKNIGDGTADIIIGTHRLLQKDVHFKDLGLIVVDEEQRFGVAHKERLKEMARQVDVLTLSATPIPRTLNMALSGIRDMSTIEEPPVDRQPIQTYVLEHDWGVLADAIKKELSRGGQVYYLHNRIESIDRAASRLSSMLENVSIGIAHGQMEQEELNRVMEAMSDGDIQVLVCTTIIETGIDIPNVNTLIIEDADKMGLAQLHQIRGRVGRSSRRAYAYLTFRKGKVLSEVADKRLSAIREFAEFNSGFKIAMRDLEIRGAGNLLGPEQSGHLMSVGYDLYLKLLEEAVLEEKGEKKEVHTECSADLTVSAYIPDSYIPSGEQRMDLYRRIAHIRTEEDADDVTDELVDRFGDPPKSVNTLIYVALMRGEASRAGISDISQKGGYIRYVLTDFDMARISALYNMPQYKGRLKLEAGSIPAMVLHMKPGADAVTESMRLIRAYTEAAK